MKWKPFRNEMINQQKRKQVAQCPINRMPIRSITRIATGEQ